MLLCHCLYSAKIMSSKSRNSKQQEVLQRSKNGFANDGFAKNIHLNQQEALPTMPNDNQILNFELETYILRVHVNCHGCRQKVKKILRRIEGVYSVKIDAEEEKVTVRGKVDSARLISKLSKSGKHAELWLPNSNPVQNEDSDHQINNNKDDPEWWFQRNKNQLNLEEDWSNEIDLGQFEDDPELHEYEATPEMEFSGHDHNYIMRSRDFPAYLYQHYPPTASWLMPDVYGYQGYYSWMSNEPYNLPNINSMRFDGHMQYHPTWSGQNPNPLRAYGFGYY